MYYNTFNDYLIDNRNGLLEEIYNTDDVAELREACLNAYDFVAVRAIEHLESYKILKGELIKTYGKEAIEEIEVNSGHRFMDINTAADKYIRAVRSKKKVGYSAEEE